MYPIPFEPERDVREILVATLQERESRSVFVVFKDPESTLSSFSIERNLPVRDNIFPESVRISLLILRIIPESDVVIFSSEATFPDSELTIPESERSDA